MALLAVGVADSLHAQVARDSVTDWLVSANADGEAYLRALQLVAAAPLYPWSLRAFSAEELRHLAAGDSAHPWQGSFSVRRRSTHISLIAPDLSLLYNSRLPYGANDGPIWAGRGFTTAVTVGVRAAFGPMDVVLAPQFFRSQNDNFAIVPTGLPFPGKFADARRYTEIDLPQRFGDVPYQRLDPGQSTVRVTALGFTAGVSTANEFWGPAVSEPFLLSNNAGGFRHLFLGTARPLGLGGVSVHLRGIAGKLDQSDFSTTNMVGRGRYLSGLVAVLTARQLPGLEVGGGRLFHNYYSDSTVTLGKVIGPVLQGILKKQRAEVLGNAGDEPDNQLASMFARWAFPASRMEVYLEYGREDYAFDLRDLVLEPDHDVGVITGFRKAWKRSGNRLLMISTELFNDRLSHLARIRAQQVPYVHGTVTQGHTQLGQLLGAPDLMGGGGESASLELYTPGGHAALRYSRAARDQQFLSERTAGVDPFDVVHALGYEQTSFHGNVDFTAGVTAVYDMNRDFTGRDVFNLHFTARANAHW